MLRYLLVLDVAVAHEESSKLDIADNVGKFIGDIITGWKPTLQALQYSVAVGIQIACPLTLNSARYQDVPLAFWTIRTNRS